MLQIPLSPIPNQKFSIVLDSQNCVIELRQLGDGMFCSLMCDQIQVFSGLICNDRRPMPTFQTINFRGHLMIVDTLGKEHPMYDKLGSRFQLVYLQSDEA